MSHSLVSHGMELETILDSAQTMSRELQAEKDKHDIQYLGQFRLSPCLVAGSPSYNSLEFRPNDMYRLWKAEQSILPDIVLPSCSRRTTGATVPVVECNAYLHVYHPSSKR